MNYLRIAGFVAGAAAVVGLVLWVVATLHKAEQFDGYLACTKAATSPASPLDACDDTIRARVTAARQGAVCDAALKNGDAYQITMTCSAPIKQLGAERDVARTDLADAQAMVTAVRAERDKAVARAEARVQTLADRKAANDRTIQSAPRTPDGRVHCDAECVRALAR